MSLNGIGVEDRFSDITQRQVEGMSQSVDKRRLTLTGQDYSGPWLSALAVFFQQISSDGANPSTQAGV